MALSVDQPLWSTMTYLKNYCMDYHEILFTYSNPATCLGFSKIFWQPKRTTNVVIANWASDRDGVDVLSFSIAKWFQERRTSTLWWEMNWRWSTGSKLLQRGCTLVFLELPRIRGAGWVWRYLWARSWVQLCWSIFRGMRGSPQSDCKLLRGRLWLLFVLKHRTSVQSTRPYSSYWVGSDTA